MRKGLWSPDEDERLRWCLTENANDSWSDIARKAGLQRCGKSCRRRWMNHLRSGLKRGKFSTEEIRRVVQLHQVLGNSWSKIAANLAGRTDNDLKNLWNSKIKRHLRSKQNNGTPTRANQVTFDPNAEGDSELSHSCSQRSILQPQLSQFQASQDHVEREETNRNCVPKDPGFKMQYMQPPHDSVLTKS